MLRTAVIIAALTAAAPLWGQAMTYQVYSVTPALNNYPVFETGPLPPTCKPGRVLTLTACRGEYESASFVLDTPEPLRQVRLRIGALRGPTTLPRDCTDAWLVQHVPRSASIGSVAMPWLLVHDPTMLELIPGYGPGVAAMTNKVVGPDYGVFRVIDYKQAHECWLVLRKPLVDAPALQPVDVEAREQFWLTVHVPADAPAGEYEAVVVVEPENAPPTSLLLRLRVPDFDLLPAPFEYSVYHPIDHVNPALTDTQLLGDYRLMASHGLLNPNLYAGPQGDKTGPIRFDRLNHLLDLREQAGLPKGVPLYLFDGAGLLITDRPLTAEEKARNAEVAAATVAWAKGRGYGDVYFMGADEFSGERLRAERDSWEAVRAGGAKIYVACYQDFPPLVGDLLDCAVLMDPDALTADWHQWTGYTRDVMRGKGKALLPTQGYWGSGALLREPYRSIISGQHERGYKVFTYMDPVGGSVWPDDHRRCRGLGMYKTGLDGTMTWAWTHYRERGPTTVGQETGISGHGFAQRGPEAPLSTLALEGFREGHDDARYLATLQARIAAGGKEAEEARRWLEGVGLQAGLAEWRAGMVRWIERLRDAGGP